jgi:hypothetical protein
MLIQFTDSGDRPVFVNPQFVIAVREDKHFGRPGVGSESEYRDTLIVMTRCEFNVKEPLEEVAAAIGRVAEGQAGGADQAGGA